MKVSHISNDTQRDLSVHVADKYINVFLIAAPLKGIPKAPFRSPTAPSMFSPPSNRTPIAPARTPLRKERGVKVILHHIT